MPLTTGVTRWSLLALLGAGIVLLGWWVAAGPAMWSPGPLNQEVAAAPLGDVRSHGELSRRCEACHAGTGSREVMSDRCLACHTAVQADLSDSSSLHGSLTPIRPCIACHTEHRGATAALTRFDGRDLDHNRFGFSLAAHRKNARGVPFSCGDCHRQAAFRWQPDECRRCHVAYQRQEIEKHIQEFGSDCRSCHDGLDRFSRGRFTHDTAGFRLDGAHLQTRCAGCHAGTRTVADFRNAPRDCVGCHRAADRHRGKFGEDCGSCHSTASWEGATVEHTKFPLDHGERGIVACRTCHADLQNFQRYTCYGCHEHSPGRILREHQEEGIRGNLEGCVRCHEGGREGEGEGREGGDDD